MALLRCPDCGQEYSSRLDSCPRCHAPAADAPVITPSSSGTRGSNGSGGPGGRRELRDFNLPGATRIGWLEGMVFKGKYELVQKLGRGAYGEAWKVKDLESSDEERAVHVVLKLLPQEVSGSRLELQRVKKNFQKVHALFHSRIAAHLAFEQDADGCMVVMELVNGVTLGEYRFDYAEERGDFPVEEAVRICRQIAEGLDYAHSRLVVHRDIKPENIMLTPEGDVKILDFGLAAEIRTSMSRVSKQDLDTSGTRPYMAPEQWRSLPPQYGMDQYALAVVFYELLHGDPPFLSDDPAVLRECVLRDEPQPLPMLSEARNSVLRKALAKDPSERYATCTAFIDAMAAADAETAPEPEPKEETKPEPENEPEQEQKPEPEEPDVSETVSAVALLPDDAVKLVPTPFLRTLDALLPEDTATLTPAPFLKTLHELLPDEAANPVTHPDPLPEEPEPETPAELEAPAMREAPAEPEQREQQEEEEQPEEQEQKEQEQSESDSAPVPAPEPAIPAPPPEKDANKNGKLDVILGVLLGACILIYGASSTRQRHQAPATPAPSRQPSAAERHDAAMEAWVKEQPVKLGEKLTADFAYTKNWTISKGSSLMSFAAAQGREDVMEWLKANGESVNVKSQSGETPIHEAATIGDVASLKWLKDNGADVNAKRNDGYTPMHIAALNGYTSAMKWLKENGADVNAKDNNGLTPMHRAASAGQVAAMKWLKENGTHVNVKRPGDIVPMHEAAWNGHIAAMEWLKANGADVIAETTDGNTPLSYATEQGHTAAADWLRANGGDPVLEEKMRTWVSANLGRTMQANTVIDSRWLRSEGSSLMSAAVTQNRADVLKWLKERGADVNARDRSGGMPLHEAAWKGNVDMMNWLTVNSADMNARSVTGETPLHYAAIGGHIPAMEWLKRNGADMNAKNNDGNTPEFFAAIGEQPAAVEWLRKNGGDAQNVSLTRIPREEAMQAWLDAQPIKLGEKLTRTFVVDDLALYEGSSLMMFAAVQGRVDVMEWLREKGEYIHIKDAYSSTLMHYAARGGHTAVMEWLKANGLDINTKTNAGRTPLDFAYEEEARTWIKANGGDSVYWR